MKKTIKEIVKQRKHEFFGIFLIVMGFLNIISLLSKDAGIIGDNLVASIRFLVGEGIYLVPVMLLFLGISMIYRSKIKFDISSRMIGIIIMLLVILVTRHFHIKHPKEFEAGLIGRGGGVLGASLLYILRKCFAELGTYVVLIALFLVGFLLAIDKLLVNLLMKVRQYIKKRYDRIRSLFSNKKKKGFKLAKLINKFKITNNKSKKKEKNQSNKKKNKKVKKKIKSATKQAKKNNSVKKQNKNRRIRGSSVIKSTRDSTQSAIKEVAATSERKVEEKKEIVTNKKEKPRKRVRKKIKSSQAMQQQLELEEYKLPPLSLLDEASEEVGFMTDKTDILKETLDNFGVRAEVTDVNHGPTITRYEIQPAPGVKVSKILNLADDIALSLAASDVRIEAPIPGKAAVGIEIPNEDQSLVTVSEILEADQFQKAESKLTMALGKDIGGNTVVADLSQMPHMLVAGATGSGKSVFINTVINSILYKSTPDEVKFLLIDPKMVELTVYEQIPHLVAPVVTDAKKAATALRWVVKEMENRYELFAGSGARGIDSYNKKLKQDGKDSLPYIVVIIDELADLMMVAAKEVEDAICRLAQKARAAGIHLILATQRPSVDVITGVIKANIPTRVSFALSSQADSRTILDTGGAEKLLGKGDMLFAPVGSNQPKRLQGAFISDNELQQVVDFVKNQEKPEYAEKIAKIKDKTVEIELDDEKDELYEKAVKLVVKNRASISMLQRKLRIGYNRAARMIDTMEKENIVGPHRGSKAREVLIEESDLEKVLKK